MKLSFVTSNKGKAKEVQEILGFPINIVEIELDEIQSLDLEEIVKHKILEVHKKVEPPFIVDDAGVFIHAWNGFPGPLIKFLTKAGGNELLLKMMNLEKNRSISIQAAIGFYDGRDTQFFSGECIGTLTETPKGIDGWGYDPIFIPEGSHLTFAEMGPTEKNKISHRRKAVEKLKEYLQTNNIEK